MAAGLAVRLPEILQNPLLAAADAVGIAGDGIDLPMIAGGLLLQCLNVQRQVLEAQLRAEQTSAAHVASRDIEALDGPRVHEQGERRACGHGVDILAQLLHHGIHGHLELVRGRRRLPTQQIIDRPDGLQGRVTALEKELLCLEIRVVK